MKISKSLLAVFGTLIFGGSQLAHASAYNVCTAEDGTAVEITNSRNASTRAFVDYGLGGQDVWGALLGSMGPVDGIYTYKGELEIGPHIGPDTGKAFGIGKLTSVFSLKQLMERGKSRTAKLETHEAVRNLICK